MQLYFKALSEMIDLFFGETQTINLFVDELYEKYQDPSCAEGGNDILMWLEKHFFLKAIASEMAKDISKKKKNILF